MYPSLDDVREFEAVKEIIPFHQAFIKQSFMEVIVCCKDLVIQQFYGVGE